MACLCIFTPLGLGPVQTALAAQVSLAWDPSPGPDIVGYKIHFGRVSGAQTESVDVGNATSYTLMGLPEGATYYFAATAYDLYGRESVFSNEVSTTIASACTYAVAPAGQSFTASGGSGTVAVTATAGCSWTASETVSWVTVTSGASGTGNGTVGYSVAANTGAARSAAMTIAGRSLTISQAAGACTYAISPASQSFTASGGGTVAVTATAGCSWTASETVSWVTVTSGASGTGSGTAGYSVAANTGAARSATMTVAGRSLTISQAAAPATFAITASAGTEGAISPAGAVSVPSGSSRTFTITPSARYRISTVIVDGVSLGALSSYTFSNVKAAHTIRATFRRRYF